MDTCKVANWAQTLISSCAVTNIEGASISRVLLYSELSTALLGINVLKFIILFPDTLSLTGCRNQSKTSCPTSQSS